MQEILLRLTDRLRPMGDPAAIMRVACALLGEALNADRANYAEVDGDDYVVAHEHHRGDLASMAGRYSRASFRPAEREALEAGRTVVIADLEGEPDVSGAELAIYLALDARAFVSVPLVKEGHLVAVLSVIRSRASRWTSVEVAFVEEFAERTWAAVARARVETALRESDARQGLLLRLSDILRPLSDPVEIQGQACQVLAEWLDVERADYVEFDARTGVARVDRDYVRHGAASLAGEHALANFEWSVEILRRGECHVIPNTQTSPLIPDAERPALAALGIIACIGAPLIEDGELVGALFVVASRRRDWTQGQAAMLQEAAQRIWVAVERARAESALRESEERQAFLLNLSDDLRPLMDAVEIQTVAMRSVAKQLDVFRAGYYEVETDQDSFSLTARWEEPGTTPLPDRMSLDDYGAYISDGYRAGRTLVVRDTERESPSEANRAACRAIGVRAWAGVPLVKSGHLLTIVGIHSKVPRQWTPAEIRLIEEVAERTWAAVERARAEAALASSEARLREFGEASSDVLWIRDAATLRWTYLTPAFEAIYGLPRQEVLAGDDFNTWLDLIAPGDRDRVAREFARVQAGERVSFEYRVQRPKDGEVRWLRTTGFPIRGVDGHIKMIGGVGHDATKAKRAEEGMRELQDRQSVLVAELQHRTRNLMAVVRALSEQTLLGSTSHEEFAERFDNRLGALSRANNLLSNLDKGQRVAFDELIRTELEALGDGVIGDNEVSLSGPRDVALRSTSVQTLALALHELATNALKYGALAQPKGRLAIRWHLTSEDGHPWLNVDWRETGLAEREPGAGVGRGAGRELIERALPYQLGARTTYAVKADGVHCTIALRVSERGSSGPGDP